MSAWLAAELPPSIPPACVARAADYYSVPVMALVAILRQEGGQVGRTYAKHSGVYFGPFQVSNKWEGYFGRLGISAYKLQYNACSNVVAGAYVLAYYKVREYSWYRAIARYNVGSLDTPTRREAGYRYANAVLGHWQRIYNKWNFPS